MDALYDATDWRTFFSIRLRQLGRTRFEFAAALGKSEGWLSQVASGRRRLDRAMVPAMINEMRLDARAAAYFDTLVDLDSDSPRTRLAAWARVAATQRQRASAGLREEEAKAVSRWYVRAVFELVRCDGFRPESEWIARTLAPPITVEQATEAMATLIRLGLVTPDDQGRLNPRAEVWSPSDLPPGDISRAVTEAHRATIDIAGSALTTLRENERNITGSMVAVSEEHYARIVARLQDLEREVLAYAADDPGVRNRVYHLGIQWFPVSDFTDTEDYSMTDSSQGPPPDIDPDTTE